MFPSGLIRLSGGFPSTLSINLLVMSNSPSTRFECPNCAAKYLLVRAEGRTDSCLRNYVLVLRRLAEWPRGSVRSQIFPDRTSKTARWQTLNLFAPNAISERAKRVPREALLSKVLAALGLVGVMRISEPSGVRITEFSST